jgi:hypothetical protein
VFHISRFAPRRAGSRSGAVERVVGLVLEVVEDRLVVRDEVDVDRRDVAAVDQRADALPEAETPSYCPVRISSTISSEVPATLS